jgi:hypothetical protein
MKKILVLSALACVLPALSQENYGQWTKYRTLTLNTTNTSGGANTSGNVRGFPVLVRLTSSQADVFTQAKTGGADLRFTKSDGVTRLGHEIEQWDSAGQSAAIWVRLDTAYGNNNSQSIRVYWGRASAADSSKGASVFRTGDNYQGVWHLSGMSDATANANNGTNTGTTDTAGAMGRGRHFNGTSAYIDVGNSAAMNSGVPFSIEGWVSWQSIGTGATSRYRPLLTHGTSASGGGQVFLQPRRPSSGGTDPYYSFGFYNGSTTVDARADAISDSGTWTHLTGTYDGTDFRVYRNGVLAATTARSGTISNATTNWFIGGGDGNGATTPSRYYFGKMDEVRFSDAVRDSNWIRLSYETQKAVSTAWTVGATQTTVATAPPTALDYSSDTAVYSLGVAITPNTATVTGIVDSFTVAPALPAGLILNKTSGAVTGTPSALTAAANYVITATNSLGTAKDTLRLSVVAATLSINYTATVSYLAGAAIAPLTPSMTGQADSFTVAPALPAGLILNKTSGAVTGAPSAATAAANYVVTATNGSGSVKDTINITVVASESYSTWGRHRTLWLNTTANGANVSTNVLNFPVLVRLTTTDTIYAQVIAKAADLRFTKANDVTRLPHQIESWDSAGKTASIWVLVDSVKGNSRDHTIRMHWTKAGAQDLSNGPSVFDTSRGFRAVFHFGEGTSDTAYNATQYAFRGVPQRTATTYSFPEDTVGVIGRARRYGIGAGTATTNNAGSYFTVDGSAAPLDFAMNGPYTLSVWAYVNETGTSRTLVSKSDRQYAIERRNTGADWEFTEHNLPLGGWQVVGTPSTAGVWSHIMGVRNNGKSALYLDGVLMDTIPSDETNNATTTARITTTDLNIGRSPDGGTNNAARYYWRGKLDEVRVASVSRSAAWAKLEFENQKAAQTLVALTQPPVGVLRGGNSAQVVHGGSITAKAIGGGMLFQLSGASQGGQIALMDVHGRTLWSGAFPAGVNQLSWNGTAANGQPVSGGVYLARVTLNAVDGKVRTLEMKVPFTR